ncbi:hypothetical protein PIB30_080223 [Stylosanthes scabra]|uniref:Uncharacterized protein n=1 Tax=Stylosanthes scabra TaxID=79078 RepID=A0ABU6SS70_9FABA|nr:hypothetical protein [Stylosanthes scabra]
MEKQSRFDRLMQKMAEVEGAGPHSILPPPRVPTAAARTSASTPATPAPRSFLSALLRLGKSLRLLFPSSLFPWRGRRKRLWGYDFWAALDSGLTQGLIREILGPVLPEQLLGTAKFLACKLTACLQVSIENAFAAKVGLEKELAATKDQVDVLTAERDSTLAAPLLKVKIDSLTEELRLVEGGRLSALARMKQMEEGAKTALDQAEAVAGYWRKEWKALAEEIGEMVLVTMHNTQEGGELSI